ncbi:hypothetical protein DER44DRAFT_850571 [Fusarium oxysporum]|nr:hypothetical protein DER44DRAFT_850571 [Fusarium oxysporum]
MNNSTLHAAILSSFIHKQRPPTTSELASHQILEDYHGVVLHSHSGEVWVAHPFSATPTACIAESGGYKWWGNFAWWSLGVIHLVGGDATLTTRLGAIGDEVHITVKDGILFDKYYVVHFPALLRNVWYNVIYTCSVHLLFHNEVEVEEWLIKQIWHFDAEWYDSHADLNWRKWSLHDPVEIFRHHGLTGPAWTFGGDTGRY